MNVVGHEIKMKHMEMSSLKIECQKNLSTKGLVLFEITVQPCFFFLKKKIDFIFYIFE
jgi:hypothetical protein